MTSTLARGNQHKVRGSSRATVGYFLCSSTEAYCEQLNSQRWSHRIDATVKIRTHEYHTSARFQLHYFCTKQKTMTSVCLCMQRLAKEMVLFFFFFFTSRASRTTQRIVCSCILLASDKIFWCERIIFLYIFAFLCLAGDGEAFASGTAF